MTDIETAATTQPSGPDRAPFGIWLLAQVHRDDSVGDLARDVGSGWCPCATCTDPDRVPAAWSVADTLQDLGDHDAGPLATAVVERAAAEWTSGPPRSTQVHPGPQRPGRSPIAVRAPHPTAVPGPPRNRRLYVVRYARSNGQTRSRFFPTRKGADTFAQKITDRGGHPEVWATTCTTWTPVLPNLVTVRPVVH